MHFYLVPYNSKNRNSLIWIESRNGIHTPEYGQQIGLGNRTYTLVDIDE